MVAFNQAERPEALELTEVVWIGRNAHGYTFGVGRLGDRWVGFARGEWSEHGEARQDLFVFPEVSYGPLLGLPDRTQAILITGAIAQDPVHGYGGVEEWLVPPELRGDPDAFRCEDCGDVGCQGECHEAGLEWLEDEAG